MLEKPNLPDGKILACLQANYGLNVVHLVFLPLGADLNTAVYRAVAADNAPYFVKLRRGVFDEASVAVPRFLGDQGITQIIAPVPTQTGQLWSRVDAFRLILYPFVEGHNGYEVNLSDRHWFDLGRALKGIHTAPAPPALSSTIQQETYIPQWREIVKTFLARVEVEVFDDPIAVETAAFLKANSDAILDLVRRAERLASALQSRPPAFVLCHSDIHAGNVLIDADGALHIVDWDSPILAPKERDLMSIGGGLMGAGHTAQEEGALFYRGYGQTPIDSIALAYYRYERIIQDIAVECEQIFLTTQGGADREQALHYLKSNFLPDQVIEIAYRSDQSVASGLDAR